MNKRDPVEIITEVFASKREAIDDVISSAMNEVGKEIPLKAITPLFITIAKVLRDLYDFQELELKLAFGLKAEIDQLAIMVNSPIGPTNNDQLKLEQLSNKFAEIFYDAADRELDRRRKDKKE